MASHNDITGDALVSKNTNDNYRDNYDRVFGKKNVQKQETSGDSTAESVSELRDSERDGVCGTQQPE